MPQSLLAQYGFASLSIAVAIGARILLDPVLGEQYPFATLFLAVLGSAWFGGRRPALASVVLGSLASDYFLLAPRSSFKLAGFDQRMGLALFAVTGLGIAWLGGSMHDARMALAAANAELEGRVRVRAAERDASNDRLRESEERYRLIVEGVNSHAIFRLDPTGVVTSWNPGAERIKGYRADEIIGQHFSRFYSPEEVAAGKPERELQIAIREGFYEEEGERLRKDGSKFWANVTITPIFGRGSEPAGFVKVTRDIGKRKAMEHSLREAALFNRATLDGLSAYIAILDGDGTIEAVNRPWEDFGAANGIAAGQSSVGDNYLADCDRSDGQYSLEGPLVAEGIRQVLAGSIPHFVLEYPCHAPDRDRWFVVRVTPFPGGGRRRVIVAHENITERKEFEVALRAERDRFDKIVTAVPLVICSYRERPDGTASFPFANAAIESIYGYRPDELARDATPIFSRMHPDEVAGIRASLDESAKNLTPWRGEFRVQNPARGELWVEGHVIPSAEPDGSVLWQGYIADITDRKRAEAVLRDRERMLAIVTGTARVGLVVVGKDYRYRFANRAYAEIFELDAERIVGGRVGDVLPAGWSQIQSRLDRALAGESVEYELVLPARSASEKPRHYSIVYHPHTDEKGEPTVVVVVVDMTVPRRAEEALRNSEARFRGAFEHTNVATVITDIDNRFLQANAAFARLFGYGRHEIEGLSLADLTHPDDLTESLARREKLMAENADHFEMEKRYHRKDGGVIWGLTNVSLVRDGEGRPLHYVGQVQDITERKRAEGARELFRELIDRTHDAIEVVDLLSGRFLDGNAKAWEILGYSREEFLTLGVADIDPSVAVESWGDRIEMLRRNAFPVIETVHRRRDGTTFPVEVNFKVVRLDREYLVAGVRDITDRKRVERRTGAQHAVARILATSPSLDVAGREILQSLCEILGWDFGELWHVDREANALRCSQSWHRSGPELDTFDRVTRSSEFAPGVGLPGRIWTSGKAAWIPDIGRDDNFPRAASAVAAGLRGAAGFPIATDGKFLGAFAFYARNPERPDDDTFAAMTDIGSQIGQFIERKRAAEELGEHEGRLRLAMQAAHMGWWVWDIAAHRTTYSDELGRLFGLPDGGGTASRDLFLSAIHAADRERFEAVVAKVLEIGLPYDVEYRVVWPDGSDRWIASRGQLYRDAAGRPIRVVGVSMDISERKRAEAATRLQQQRLEGIVNSAMDGIVTIDENQRIILTNAAADRMFGYAAGEALGRGVEIFIPERFRVDHTEHVRRFGQTGVASRSMGSFGPISGLRASGEEFPIEASISQIEMDGHRIFTVTCRDVTERARAAQAQRTLEAQLQQSQKMEAFGQLAGGMAHDFNNLLTVISGYSEMLLMILPPGDANAMVAAIHGAGERAASLTRQLLAFSRQQVLEPRVLDLNTVVVDIEKMLRRLIGEDVQLTTALRPDLPSVKVDPGQIEQVVMNLAVNARDAMPRGGKLTIETDTVELDATYAKTHAEVRPGRYVRLAISDTGSGMTPEVQARLFEPFFTTKGVGKGTGLGLAVVHGIVKQSGGRIELYSELGVGTTFKIYLPEVQERPRKGPDARLDPAPGGKESILLVEDEDGVREFASRVLRKLGYRVQSASGGHAALELAADGEPIDILVTDVVMPEMSGRILAETLQSRRPGLKVLFLSGYTDDAVVRHGVLQADVAFLQKPFTPNSLGRKVRDVLDS